MTKRKSINKKEFPRVTRYLCGRIRYGPLFPGSDFYSIQVIDDAGCIHDIFCFLVDILNNCGDNLSIRYWISDGPQFEPGIFNKKPKSVVNTLMLLLETYDVAYSEWTSSIRYILEINDKEPTGNRHDLIAELETYNGKYVYLEIGVQDG